MHAKPGIYNCHEVKGRVFVGIQFILDVTDPRYDEYFMYVPVDPVPPYPGKIDKYGVSTNKNDYLAWRDGLPHEWRATEIHTHCEYVDPSITDVELKALIEDNLKFFSEVWNAGKGINEEWAKYRRKKITFPGNPSIEMKAACLGKALDILGRISDFEVKEK